MQANITGLRWLIVREIQLVGEEEIGELARLASIETLVAHLIAEHRAILRAKLNGADIAYLKQRLTRMYDETIDRRFNPLILEAIEDEAAEVSETRRFAAERTIILRIVTVIFALISVAATAISLWMLLRDVRRPLKDLHGGAAALAAGDLDHRITIAGPRELTDLAQAFNHMAEEIATREAAISRTNRDLEETIARRTAELQRALERLKANEVNRRQFLADVSHELRTPLTIIRGEADIALRLQPKPADVYREALEKVRSAVEHTARLVDDLLFVARHEAGETRLRGGRSVAIHT